MRFIFIQPWGRGRLVGIGWSLRVLWGRRGRGRCQKKSGEAWDEGIVSARGWRSSACSFSRGVSEGGGFWFVGLVGLG